MSDFERFEAMVTPEMIRAATEALGPCVGSCGEASPPDSYDIRCAIAAALSACPVPAGWKLVQRKTCFALHHGTEVVATLAGPQAEANAAVLAAVLAAAPTAPAPAQPTEPAPSVEAKISLLIAASPDEVDAHLTTMGLDPQDVERRGVRAVEAALTTIKTQPAEPPPMTFQEHQRAWIECRHVEDHHKVSLIDRIEAVINARDEQWRAALKEQS